MRFFTRPGCHLCDDALPTVRRAARWARRDLEIVDIETDDELVTEYGLRIPVVSDDDGRVLAEGEIRLWPLLRAMLVGR